MYVINKVYFLWLNFPKIILPYPLKYWINIQYFKGWAEMIRSLWPHLNNFILFALYFFRYWTEWISYLKLEVIFFPYNTFIISFNLFLNIVTTFFRFILCCGITVITCHTNSNLTKLQIRIWNFIFTLTPLCDKNSIKWL